MAWNQPGNNNNNKRRDPWQDGDPPDLEEALKNMKDRIARLFGGGGGGNSGGGNSGNSGKSDNSLFMLAGLVFGGIVILWLGMSTWTTIDESQRGVVLRFGKFNRILEPGLSLKLPAPIETVQKVEALRVRSISEEMRMLTSDENFVMVDYNIQFQAADARKYLFKVRSPEETLQQVASSAVRQVVGGNTLDAVLSGERTQMAANCEGPDAKGSGPVRNRHYRDRTELPEHPAAGPGQGSLRRCHCRTRRQPAHQERSRGVSKQGRAGSTRCGLPTAH
ncbi:MAG: protease modulator HflK [Ahniella sp.]|nr:protease modulator HflK [Ahniella sp.]